MNTDTAARGPLCASADNAGQIVAALLAVTDGRHYRHTFNGELQDGLYTVAAAVTSDSGELAIRIQAPAGTLVQAPSLTAFRVKQFGIVLPLSSLDGGAPGEGRPALRVELLDGAIRLHSTEPEDGGPVDYTYELTDAGQAPADSGRTVIIEGFDGPEDTALFARILAEQAATLGTDGDA